MASDIGASLADRESGSVTTEGAPDTDTEQEQEESTETEVEQPDRSAAEIEKWKTLSRKHEAESKKNAEAAKRLAELEESQKSESEKITDGLAKSQARVAELEAELIRERVARRHSLTDDQARRLIGSTEEELDADAAELTKLFTVASDEDELEEAETNGHRQPPSTPKPRIKSAAKPPANLNDDKLLTDLKRKLGVK